MEKKYIIKNVSDIEIIARKIIKDFGSKNVFTFYGKMGAGKTTIIKDMCKYLKVVDNVTSPTFALLNEYYTSNEELICHFDFYRIEDSSEIERIGFFEYLDYAYTIFIEWPEKAENLLPDDRVDVSVIVKDEIRYLTVKDLSDI